MIIAISGLHGTGKSTVAKKIAELLNLKYYSTGEAFRELAKQMNMSLKEFSDYAEQHSEIDLKLDEKIIDLAKKGNIIIDSQLSGYLLKDIADFKILLTCPLNIRVKRMAERDNSSFQEKLEETKHREESERIRFKKLYNIDLSDQKKNRSIFDLVLNTGNLTVNEVIDIIMEKIKQKSLKN
ncbi:MAG: (d)CMP kinase [Promethearchaeota archaeon]